ncbi:hypothetical protein DERP_014477 [Dermatophagoides pteronyssinus]|uniref:Uncharacterized protein n=1 Tax=Dermatophagoides pteronyssinus TaxID=6956 RepID=A0ABQ8IUN2_DERPT|nr:hypothetical protein DERP_014477 [Dermatophagoides pteronyssinus]
MSILNQYPSVIDSIAKEKLLRFVQDNARKYFVIRNELDTMSSKETRCYEQDIRIFCPLEMQQLERSGITIQKHFFEFK